MSVKTFTLLSVNMEGIEVMPDLEKAVADIMVRDDISSAVDLGAFEAVALIEARNLEDAFDVDCNPSRSDDRQNQVVNFINRGGMKVGDVLIDNKTGIFSVCKVMGFDQIDAFNYSMPQISGRNPNWDLS